MVDADRVLDAGLAHDLAGADAVVVLGAAADPEVEAPVVHLVDAGVDDADRNAGGLGVHDRLLQRAASGIDTTMASGFSAIAASIRRAICTMSKVSGAW